MIGEEIWFSFAIWIIILVIGLKTKNPFFGALSAVFSFFLGFLCFTDVYAWMGILLFISGLYLLYNTLFNYMQTGKKRK